MPHPVCDCHFTTHFWKINVFLWCVRVQGRITFGFKWCRGGSFLRFSKQCLDVCFRWGEHWSRIVTTVTVSLCFHSSPECLLYMWTWCCGLTLLAPGWSTTTHLVSISSSSISLICLSSCHQPAIYLLCNHSSPGCCFSPVKLTLRPVLCFSIITCLPATPFAFYQDSQPCLLSFPTADATSSMFIPSNLHGTSISSRQQ